MIARFEPWHVEAVRAGLDVEHHRYLDMAAQVLPALCARELASTIMTPCGAPVAILAAAEQKDGCEVFIFASRPAMRKHTVTFWRELRQEIVRMQKRFARIRALSNSELSARFLKKLGFRLEGVCKRAGPELGMLMWVMEGSTA